MEESGSACEAVRLRLAALREKHIEAKTTASEKLDIRVVARLRPLLPEIDGAEAYETTAVFGAPPGNVCWLVSEPASKSAMSQLQGKDVAATLEERSYALHGAHGADEDDESFFDSVCAPLLEHVIAGGRATYVAYGHTGAGKTRGARDVQRRAGERILQSAGSLTLKVSYFENAGEKCLDLLNDHAPLTLRTDEHDQVQVVGLREHKVRSVAELDEAMRAGNEARATAATERHGFSSRSHALCSLELSNGGRLRIVDLAGSERLTGSKTLVDEKRLTEASEINASLMTLNECLRLRLVAALSTKPQQQHLPFRRSKLTMLLRDCFESSSSVGQSSKTVFVAHVSPSSGAATETRRTLDYALAALEATRLEKETKAFKGVERWSPANCQAWAAKFSEGKYAHLAPAFSKSGKTMSTIYRGDLVRSIEALGGTEEDADVLYDAFFVLVKKSKAQARAAEKKKAGATPATAPSKLALSIAKDAALLRENKAAIAAGGADGIYGRAGTELEALHLDNGPATTEGPKPPA